MALHGSRTKRVLLALTVLLSALVVAPSTAPVGAQLAPVDPPAPVVPAGQIALRYTITAPNTVVTLPIRGLHATALVNATVNWGDGTPVESVTADLPTHTFAVVGTFDVFVDGSVPWFGFGTVPTNPVTEPGYLPAGHGASLTHVWSLGALGTQSMNGAFFGATGLVDVPALLPATVVDLTGAFQGATAINDPDIAGWVTVNARSMQHMFNGASAFDQSLALYDLTNIGQDIAFLYSGAVAPPPVDCGGGNPGGVPGDDDNPGGGDNGGGNDDDSVGAAKNGADDGNNCQPSPPPAFNTMALEGMLDNSGVSRPNYDSTLISWGTRPVPAPMQFSAAGRSYCDGDVERDALIAAGWVIPATDVLDCNITITWVPTQELMLDNLVFTPADATYGTITYTIGDPLVGYPNTAGCVLVDPVAPATVPTLTATGPGECTMLAVSTLVRRNGQIISSTQVESKLIIRSRRPMTLVYDVPAGGSITLPLQALGASTVNANIDWDDPSVVALEPATGEISHTYATAGRYFVAIHGTVPRFGLDGYVTTQAGAHPYHEYLVAVLDFGTIGLQSLEGAFLDAPLLTGDSTLTPRMPAVPAELPVTVTTLSGAFNGAVQFNDSNISAWDTTNVTDMSYMFAGADSFDQPLTQDLDSWNTGNVTDMSFMFHGAGSFNQNLGSWDVFRVTNMQNMFALAFTYNDGAGLLGPAAFNSIGDWDTSSVTNMSSMFFRAVAFNQQIGGWNTTNVTDMTSTFNQARSFNRSLDGWNTAKVTSMENMFSDAEAYNQSLANLEIDGLAQQVVNSETRGGMIGMLDTGLNYSASGGLDQSNYDATLIAWDAEATRLGKTGIRLGSLNRKFCLATSARSNMISASGWTISGDSSGCVTPPPPPPPPGPSDQEVIWGPQTTFWDIDTPVRLSAARSSGDGAITYSVVDAGTAGCELGGDQNRRLSFERSGTCRVRATAAATDDYLQGSVTRTILIEKAIVPGPVRNLAVVAVKRSGSVSLAWRRPAYTGTHPLIRYRVRVRERNEVEYRVVGYTAPNELNATVSGLESGVYYFRVRAANAAGAGAGYVVGPVFING